MPLSVELDVVMLVVSDDAPRVLTVSGPDGVPRLPSGPFDPMVDTTLDQSTRRWLLDQAGLEAGRLEQIYTFDGRDRDPRTRISGDRTLSIAYLALAAEQDPRNSTKWIDLYDLLPWEDHREGSPPCIVTHLAPVLEGWAEASPSPGTRATRRGRLGRAFGSEDGRWDNLCAADRYDLLYEAGLLEEAKRDGGAQPGIMIAESSAMALDHRRIVATVLSALRHKLAHRPDICELLPETFAIRQVRRVVESVAGHRVSAQGLRRLLDQADLIEATGEQTETAGRPAKLFRFKR